MSERSGRAARATRSLGSQQAREHHNTVAVPGRTPVGSLLAEPRRMKIMEWLQEEVVLASRT